MTAALPLLALLPEPASWSGESALRAELDAVAAGVVVQNASGQIVDCNPAAEQLLGLSRDQLMGLQSIDPHWQAIDANSQPLPGDQHPAMRTLADGTALNDQLMGVRMPNGQRRWLSVSTRLIGLPGDRHVVASIADVTTRRDHELKLLQRWDQLRITLEGTRTATWEWRIDSGETVIDQRWADIIGCTLQELQPTTIQTWMQRLHPDDSPAATQALRRHFAGRLDHCDVECRLQHKQGHWVWVRVRGHLAHRSRGGRPTLMFGTLDDISERKAMELELRAAAEQDRLTGLPNRSQLLLRLEQALQRTRDEPGWPLALLFLDFDRFKLVNDTMGHDAGDELLVTVAQRLRGVLAEGHGGEAFAARFGGDEFVVIAGGMQGDQAAQALAARLIDVMAVPFVLKGNEFQSGVSIGIALHNGTDTTVHEMLRNADTAMYEAKRAGRRTWVVFDQAMHDRLTRSLRVEAGLRVAIERGELSVAYQPIVDLDSGRMTSVEALLRWRHPAMGFVSPAEFIPIAEESGLIIPIGEWVLRESCFQWQRWQQENRAAAPGSMSVNLSRVQMALGPKLMLTVHAALEDAGMPPEALQLEVTERELMKDPASARDLLLALASLGVKLAMDDFGTGTSSLACLRDYPFHAIKIDRSFVTGLSHDPHVLAVAHATVNVIENLGMVSVAEGIESTAELATLQAMGCRYGQGYLFSRPLAADALLAAMAPP